MLYIRKQNWIQSFLGEKIFLRSLLLLGCIVSFASSYFLAYYDNQGVNKKFCMHLSNEDFDMLQNAEVMKHSKSTTSI